MDKIKMGELLLVLRRNKGYNQSQIAEIFNVSLQAVSKWERGESVPDIEIIERLAKYYNISIEKLLNGEIKP